MSQLADRVILGGLTAYKRVLSPHFAGSCRFLPSCADYAREAVLRHGAAHGSWLALRRLARCHPLCTAGYDPVPLTFTFGWRKRHTQPTSSSTPGRPVAGSESVRRLKAQTTTWNDAFSSQ
ncbi:MAG: membrane protein insertion efficiency factor YidD [Acidimicrobiia bacterium]|nr:membrane protein insertion efficiency factor YidD [Acidimicrobiia bacterium]